MFCGLLHVRIWEGKYLLSGLEIEYKMCVGQFAVENWDLRRLVSFQVQGKFLLGSCAGWGEEGVINEIRGMFSIHGGDCGFCEPIQSMDLWDQGGKIEFPGSSGIDWHISEHELK